MDSRATRRTPHGRVASVAGTVREALRDFFLEGQTPLDEERQERLRAVGLRNTTADSRGTIATMNLIRATQNVATGNLGAFTAPDEMMRPLEENLLHFGGVRQVATVARVSTGATLPIPTMDDTTNEGEIVDEDASVNEQTAAMGQVLLGAYKYSSKLIPVSAELLQDSSVGMAAFIGRIIGERIGRGSNRHFTVGTGIGQPEGCLTGATDSGVVTETTDEINWFDVIALKHSVDVAYRRLGAHWMFSDQTLSLLKQMRDKQNRPVWLPSLIPGEPDTLDKDPFVVNNHMPNPAAGAKVLLYGNFAKYTIREAATMDILRLDERFADNHRVAFIAFHRLDGRLIDAGTAPLKYLSLAS
ncbi:MAG: phage major capsid protein [Pirellulaceae bacterium]